MPVGRTNPTYRDTLRHLEDQWSDFRRGLRYHDQEHWDHRLESGRQLRRRGGVPRTPSGSWTSVLLSLLLAQERRICELEEQLDDEASNSTTHR